MPTYTKETALYDTGAIQSGIDGAAQTATDYITAITGGGIMVHPSGDSTSGWRIADALQLLKSSIVAFSVSLVSGMAKVVIGESNKSHAEIDYHSLQLVDKDGNTYFHVSDLRGSDGTATVEQSFVGDGETTSFTLLALATSVNYDVYLNDTLVTSGITKHTSRFVFSVAPQASASIKTIYNTSSDTVKALTFGSRDSNANVGPMSFATGKSVAASGIRSHAEGCGTEASGNDSHAEGFYTVVSGDYSHAEGYRTEASGIDSHAEGYRTEASGIDSHAEGQYTEASGYASHAECFGAKASGDHSHAQNRYTLASSDSQTALGKYNVEDANGTYAAIIGNGTADNARSNALTVDWSGNVGIAGEVRDMSGNAKYAASSHDHSASNITSGQLAIANGGTGQSGTTTVTTISSIVSAGTGCTISDAKYKQWGKLAQIYLAISCTTAKSSGNVIATVVSGKRPATTTPLINLSTPSQQCGLYDSGQVQAKASIPAGTTVYVIGTYILP